MDFLDPQKQKAHTYRILFGYVLIGLTLLTATTILLYQAYGFGYKNGQVIQSGLVFMSSTPTGADVYYNGKRHKDATNTRLVIPAGQYTFELKRDGYRDWKRAINVEGGVVVRFSYPFLIPQELVPTTLKRYETQPHLTLQSPDRRWLMIQSGGPATPFEVYDLARPDQAATSFSIPAAIMTKSDGPSSLQLVEWGDDNRHVVVKHVYTKGAQQYEYLLLDREEAAESVNLTTALGVNPARLELHDRKYDRYYLYDPATLTLSTATLKEPAPQVYLQQVLNFKSHGDSILYATPDKAAQGKVRIALYQGEKDYTVRQVAVGTTYLLDIARYGGAWYVVAGAQNEHRTYVYKNPVDDVRAQRPPVPVHVFKVNSADYVAFSDNARFVMAENNQTFGVYDAENKKGYTYELNVPLDPPQAHATWMDGHRLQLVSGGKLMVFDFDHANQEVLVDAHPAFASFYDQQYERLYSIAPQKVKAADGSEKMQFGLMRTALRTAEDL